MGLKEMPADKQAAGKGETEKDEQPAAQKKRTRTTRHATQTQPLLLAADAPFAAALEAILGEDRCRTWAAGRTIMLRRTSQRVKEVVDRMQLPAIVSIVRLSRSFWDDARNGSAKAKRQFVLRQLAAMTAKTNSRCRISTLELLDCDMKGQDAKRLAGVLAQCPALAHLDLSGNSDFGAAGTERLAGVLGQCRELVHLNLSSNWIGAGGAERLAGVLAQCTALAHLNLSHNLIGIGVESLAGVLGQCPALTYLNLRDNEIGNAGAESLAGVLAQCTALTHLDLWYNNIGTTMGGRLRASWHGQASGLVLEADFLDDDDEPEIYDEDDEDEDDFLDDVVDHDFPMVIEDDDNYDVIVVDDDEEDEDEAEEEEV
jgi:hypothetical protein